MSFDVCLYGINKQKVQVQVQIDLRSTCAAFIKRHAGISPFEINCLQIPAFLYDNTHYRQCIRYPQILAAFTYLLLFSINRL